MLLSVVFFLLNAPFVMGFSEDLNNEVLGLLVFKADIIDHHSKLESWAEVDKNPCKWVAVICNERDQVIDLNLQDFGLSGWVGKGLLSLRHLQKLNLSNNNFTGTLNASLGLIGSLMTVDLSNNKLTGSIPGNYFNQCGVLQSISFSNNYFTGAIPESLSSCSGLLRINFSSNMLSGSLAMGLWSLKNLQSLDLSDNLFSGEISEGIGGLKMMSDLNLGNNLFFGKIPYNIGSCLLLKSIDLSENSLTGKFPDSMQRLKACTSLRLRGNSFEGAVFDSIDEMKSLEALDLSSNKFSVQIPNSMEKLRSLKELNLSMNQLTGNFSVSLASFSNLTVFDISQNLLTGTIAEWLSSLANASQMIQVLDLSSNKFSGKIPSMIGDFKRLVFLNISNNLLNGCIPENIGKLNNVWVIDLSNNQLNGSIPAQLERANSLKELRLQKNILIGQIPIQIDKCSSLVLLNLGHNNLTGQIPANIANLTYLQIVDLSSNNFIGTLPKELTNLSNLLAFNISYNNFEGELPAGGFFNTINPSYVTGNPRLCGSVVKSQCPNIHPKPIVLNPNTSVGSKDDMSSPGTHHKGILLSISALIAIGAAIFIAFGVATITILNIHVRSSMLRSDDSADVALSLGDNFSCSPGTEGTQGKLLMFNGDMDFISGAHSLLNKDCELGRGGFGAVYRAMLRDGRAVAIKKLTVSSLIKSREDFETEVKRLGNVRHGNLVTLEGYYWTPSLQLLIYAYVPNGSLYKHLHEATGETSLSWKQRFNIVIGMAKGLSHLHHSGIIHYNLKSTNVLIDESSGETKLGDFGVARLLPMLDHYVLSSKIQSALGYMAPELACRNVKITEKCDVYGFGILILEIVTGKRPVEYMEDDVVVLCDMVRGLLDKRKVEECVDKRLYGNFNTDEAIPLIKLGLICASQVPSNRPHMDEVINILEVIQSSSELE